MTVEDNTPMRDHDDGHHWRSTPKRDLESGNRQNLGKETSTTVATKHRIPIRNLDGDDHREPYSDAGP